MHGIIAANIKNLANIVLEVCCIIISSVKCSIVANRVFRFNMRFTTSIQLYKAFMQTAFLRQASFRLANFSGLFTNTFFMLFRAAVFNALFVGTAKIANYSLDQALTYVVLIQIFIMVIPQWGSIGVADDIRTGQIAMDLLRPINYYLMIMAKRLGLSAFYLLARGIPALIFGICLGFFRVVPDISQMIFGFASMLLSIWIANSFLFLVEITGFWLESAQGPKQIAIACTYFLSGSVIPIAFFPPWAQAISAWLPFQYTLNSTTEILLGVATQPLVVLELQVVWAFCLGLLSWLLLERGRYKITLHGG